MAEKDRELLDKQITINDVEFTDRKEHYPPTEKIKVGDAYTVRELLRRLLSYSDNEAIGPLSAISVSGHSNDLLFDLGVTDEDGAMQKLNGRLVARFFRVLYNSTYLSPEHSEEILTFLAESSFKDGLRKGVPQDIKVVHKFGESGVEGFDTLILNDCGIVYAKVPYILCVMTEGTEYEKMADTIAGISKITYDLIVSGQK